MEKEFLEQCEKSPPRWIEASRRSVIGYGDMSSKCRLIGIMARRMELAKPR
ncbi:MAG TPA: hypothetical protein VKA35_02040 [Solirubrobacterales bacterium]|nr:hypothetical protein [Solirubrobacterales bacterium]